VNGVDSLLRMKSYWFILLGSVVIGFALFTPVVWRYRKEFARGFKETWGIAVDDDAVMQERVDALRNAEPVGWLVQVEITVIAIAAIIAFSIGAYNGGVIAVACFVLAVGLVVLFNIVFLRALPPLPDGADPRLSQGRSELGPSRGTSDQPSYIGVPRWWFVCAMFCLLLVFSGLVALLAGDLTLRLVLGVPGALGLVGLGLWARRLRSVDLRARSRASSAESARPT
jgi:hypothetical protein